MKLYLGIDGGGSKTECVIGDEKRVLGRFTAGTCKIQRVGREAATASLEAAIKGAFYVARVPNKNVIHTCLGIAGASQPGVKEWAVETVSSLVSGDMTVTGDHIIAHEAAFHGKPGILIIAGTGSIIYGRNEEGKTIRAGGWGPVVSDEGSGEWIGRTAVNAALLANDSGIQTSLLPKIFAVWKVENKEEVVRIANAFPPPNFAALFPSVMASAEEGDSLAADILFRAGQQLARLALMVAKQLWFEDQPLNVAGSGGVMTHSSLIREVVAGAITKERSQAVYRDDPIDPTLGALYIARHARA